MTEPYSALADALRLRGPTLNLLFEQARFSLERDADAVLRDALAGTIVVVMHDMLHRYWRESRATKAAWKEAGPLFAGYSFPVVLSAARDNFRYADHWDSEKPGSLLQLRSVRVLSAVLGLSAKKNGKRPPFRGNVCWPVLEQLAGHAGYSRLDALAREFALGLEACAVDV